MNEYGTVGTIVFIVVLIALGVVIGHYAWPTHSIVIK